MASCTLKYYDSLGVQQTQAFDVRGVLGIDSPYKWRMVPGKIFQMADFSQRTAYKGLQRIISVQLAPLNSNESFILMFLNANVKSVVYQGVLVSPEEVIVVTEHIDYEDSWFDDFKYTKDFTFEAFETTIQTSWPN